MKNLIRVIFCSLVFIGCIFLSAYVEPVRSDSCGSYDSGPNECVISCRRITSKDSNGNVIADYCANDATGYCSPQSQSCTYWNPGSGYDCYANTEVIDLDCAAASIENNCETPPVIYKAKGCAVNGGGGESCTYSCETGNCSDDKTGHGLGTNGCAANQYSCTTGSCGGGGGNTAADCSGTPDNLVLTKVSSSTWELSWSSGAGSNLELAYGTDHDVVANQNPRYIKLTESEAAARKYTITGLIEGAVYYFRIWSWVDFGSGGHLNGLCTTHLSAFLSSCDFNVSSLILAPGKSANVTSNILAPRYSGENVHIKKVEYTTDTNSATPTNCSDYAGINMEAICNSHPDCQYGNSINHGCYYKGLPDDIISIDPTSDSTYVYQTLVTGLKTNMGDITTLTANAYLSNSDSASCTKTMNVVVGELDPWWQVKDGDVTTNGDVRSNVPGGIGAYFDEAGDFLDSIV